MAKQQILERLRSRSGDMSLFIDLRFGVRPLRPMEPLAELPPVAEEVPEESRSIREIAEARLRSWDADRA